MKCKKCRKEIEDDYIYCPWCGKKQQATEKAKPLRRANGSGSIYKVSGRRRKQWAVRIRKLTDPQKQEYADIFLGYYETKEEAMKTLNKATEKSIDQRYNYTLEDIYNSWKADYYAKLSTKGIEGYETAWKRLSPLKDKKMRELKTSDYQNIILNAQTMERQRKDGNIRPSKPLSKSGKEKIQQLCSQLCKFATRDDIIDKNYAQMVSMPEDDTISKDIFTPQHIALLENNAQEKTAQIILVLIYTGMRINELFSIERKNVNLNEHYMIGGLKTEAGRDRFIPICKKIMPYITQWYNDSEGCNLLLTNAKGKKMSDNNFRTREFYPLIERLGICKPPKTDRNGRTERRRITPIVHVIHSLAWPAPTEPIGIF